MNTDRRAFPDFTAASKSLLEARLPMAVIRRASVPSSWPRETRHDIVRRVDSSLQKKAPLEHFAEQAPPKPSHWISVALAHDHGITVDLDSCLHAGRPGGVRSSDLHPTFFADLQHAPAGIPWRRFLDGHTVPIPAPARDGFSGGRRSSRRDLSSPDSPANARGSPLRTRPGHSEAPAFVGGTGDGAGLAVLTVADRVVDL
ncbi:hypothetical protein Q5P01_024970 [Channa striata]|uniref:Uncharacterized protein n=1 Tax=Channa striata TaxID=64152 RepID=A0AA88IUN3_CHASR|nr:hypothetical protein Q5P01_024970 [Channa striata]